MKLERINCLHWRDGACSANHFGGRPSAGVCARVCPHRVGDGPALTGEMLTVSEPEHVPFDGSAMWAELHAHEPGPDDAVWLAAFAARLPCGSCRAHWVAWVAANPPGDDWFAWSVDAHNAVNARLGRPPWTPEQARARWGR